MAVSKDNRASKRNPCRICGQANDYCLVYEDGGTLCMFVEAPGCHVTRFKDNNIGYYYPPRKEATVDYKAFAKPKPTPEVIEPEMAPINVRHAVYTKLLGLCGLTLTDEQCDHLMNERAIPEDQISNFGALDQDLAWRLIAARELAAEHDLTGIPGFYQPQPNVWSFAGPSGILIPCRTPKGHIQGFQIRLDQPNDGGKYRWFSSPGEHFPKGRSSGTFLHFANFRACPDVWVTEGGLKAQVASNLSGIPFVGLPGTTMGEIDLLLKIKHKCGSRFIICPDADFRHNIFVYRNWLNGIQSLQEKGIPVKIAVWDEAQGKGIDDLLIATGQLPRHTTPDRFMKLYPEHEVAARWNARKGIAS